VNTNNLKKRVTKVMVKNNKKKMEMRSFKMNKWSQRKKSNLLSLEDPGHRLHHLSLQNQIRASQAMIMNQLKMMLNNHNLLSHLVDSLIRKRKNLNKIWRLMSNNNQSLLSWKRAKESNITPTLKCSLLGK